MFLPCADLVVIFNPMSDFSFLDGLVCGYGLVQKSAVQMKICSEISLSFTNGSECKHTLEESRRISCLGAQFELGDKTSEGRKERELRGARHHSGIYCCLEVLVFNFPMEEILKQIASVSPFLFCAVVLTVAAFIKIAFSPFQRRINTPPPILIIVQSSPGGFFVCTL